MRMTWRTVVRLALFSALIHGSLPAVVSAQTTHVVRVTAEQVALRDAPSTAGPPVLTVVRDAELEVLASQGAWMRVRPLGGTVEGWVHSLLVTTVTLGGAQAGGAQRGAPSAVVTAPSGGSDTPRMFAVGFTGDGLGKVGGPSLRLGVGPAGLEVIGTRDDGVVMISALGSLRLAEYSPFRGVEVRPHLGGGVLVARVGDLCERRLGLPSCGEDTRGVTAFAGIDVHGGPGGLFALSGKVSWVRTPEYLGYGRLGLALGLHLFLK